MRWCRDFLSRHEPTIGGVVLALAYLLLAACGAVYIWLAATGQPIR